MNQTLQNMAEIIHKARWPADRQMEITPFEDEDQNGREYCFRIAAAVFAKYGGDDTTELEAGHLVLDRLGASRTVGNDIMPIGRRIDRFVQEMLEVAKCRYTAQELAEAKADAKELYDHFHPDIISEESGDKK